MNELIEYLALHRKSLNLAEISRLAGLDESYVKKVAQGRLVPSEKAAKDIASVLVAMVQDFPQSTEGK